MDKSSYFPSSYQEFIFYRSYSRWNKELGRRESWEEAITRFMDYMKVKLGDKLPEDDYIGIRDAILNQEICPSMRLLWSAGEACDATNVAAYNCAYIVPKTWRDLSEIMYVSMCGAGCGFSVEEDVVKQFSSIKKQTGKMREAIVVPDSKEGWAESFAKACEIWADGGDVELDYSELRPNGARLATMGGTSSGYKPLEDLMIFTRNKIVSNTTGQLTTLELHDIICQIGLIVVAGGVRRSALISMSSLGDTEMRDAKSGEFWIDNGQRSMANNSAVYLDKPSIPTLLKEWSSIIESGTGERGIFNRGAMQSQVTKRRWDKIEDQEHIGMNPCGEIYLRSKQFCNLTSIVVRPGDSENDLMRKMRFATIVGTYQATLTDFGYLSKEWQDNCEEEQLLGVSITGYYDNEIVRTDAMLDKLRLYSIEVNQEYSKRLGSNPSTAITCVKPHGNSGQLLNVGSGMHPWFSKYFIRRVRISANDPLLVLMESCGVKSQPEVGYSSSTSTVRVLEFPMKAPDGAVTNDEVSALDLLHEWKRVKKHFTEHNPSITIYVGEDEWLGVIDFVHKNWDIVGGLSFLPRTDHVYQLAPYEAITEEKYNELAAQVVDVDFSILEALENEDNTEGAKELACVGGACEI